jgi:two-component system, OmpR family, alkaline phosphatase synthesis response regulator PhoP
MNNKVLIIEDDPATSRLVDYSLRHHGYQVSTATNGLEGVRKAQTEAPDLVILDVMLPGIDGYEICHRLRANPVTAGLLILMFSAKAQEIDKETGIKVGADDYLTKPAAPAEIVARVERLLAKKFVPAQEELITPDSIVGKGSGQ